MNKRILIVEDEIIIALSMRKVLESLGYTVLEEISNGKDAIEFIKKNHPDLVFMDIKIDGEIDGIETANRIKSFSNVPVVFLTGNTDNITQNRVQTANCVDFLVKPITEEELLQVLNKIFVK